MSACIMSLKRLTSAILMSTEDPVCDLGWQLGFCNAYVSKHIIHVRLMNRLDGEGRTHSGLILNLG